MGYDQNNEYYNSGDQSWRDQTNVYQTQRELARAPKCEVAAGLVQLIAERFASGARVSAAGGASQGPGSAAAR